MVAVLLRASLIQYLFLKGIEDYFGSIDFVWMLLQSYVRVSLFSHSFEVNDL